MIISLLMIILTCSGGLALTYVFVDEETFLWRASAGTVIGSAIFGTAAFVVACFLGLTPLSIALAMAVTLLPLLLFRDRGRRHQLWLEWQRAKGKMQGARARTFLRFGYYLFFFVLFWLFFDRAMIETKDGIFTGASHNLGDLPFHLGAIFSFTDGNNFPPVNPSFAGAKFSYPFVADLVTAAAVKLGAGVNNVMFSENMAWALALLVLLESFVKKLTADRLAGKIAPALLFFSGGLGFLLFFTDYFGQAAGFFAFLRHLPQDYTLNDRFAWGNSLITLFITQRSLLLGMPLTIVILDYLWKVFVRPVRQEPDKEPAVRSRLIPSLVVGLIAGLLPLIHLHSLAVLFVVGVFVLIFQREKWHEWIAFAVGAGVIAIPELVWSLTGSASRASEFVGWNYGWDAKDTNIFLFWFRNTGLVIPLIALGAYIVFRGLKMPDEHPEKKKLKHVAEWHPRELLFFYLPFVFCFVAANSAKLAPWPWDNIKVLVYWYLGSLPLIALALAWMWEKGRLLKAASAICLFILIFAGALDVWRNVSGQIKNKVFDKDAVAIAEQLKSKTEPDALFLNAPTYNTAVVLTGRRSLMRFPGHLWSHGIEYADREADVKIMYAGGADADSLLQSYGVDYVIISPEERSSVAPNEAFFKKFPVVATVGQDIVYKVK